MRNEPMHVEMWDVGKVIPYEKNPRAHKDHDVRALADSFKTFGINKPIVVDDDGVVIAGHKMLAAAKLAKYAQVPVFVASHLSPDDVRAYRLRDNRESQNATWIDDILAAELRALQEVDYDLNLTGFSALELDQLLADPTELGAAEETPVVPVVPVSVEGDVWLLGKHRIVCGDSTSAADVAKALNGVKPHLMVTDPPYGVEYDPAWREEAVGKGKAGNLAKGKVLNDDKADWREVWALFPGDVAYIWHGGLHSPAVAESLKASGFNIRAQIIWVKHRAALSRGHYHWGHEPAFYAERPGKSNHWQDDHEDLAYAVKEGSKASWSGSRKETTVWTIEHRKNDTGHGTQKPIECMLRPIKNNSSPGQAVFEPFSGSGTTIIACEMSGRVCHALELSPAYVDVAVLRWQGFTKLDAVHEATGKTYAELEAERLAPPSDKPAPNAPKKAAQRKARKEAA